MKWSFPIARVLGIELRVHVTFFLLIVFYGWLSYSQGGMQEALLAVAFILLLFLCVVLHEFGHALAARMYGIHTPDITLLPIGGLARLERMPRNPVQELVIAVAGPAVNVVIACILGAFLIGKLSLSAGMEELARPSSDLMMQVLVANVILVLFNLIPAFPMDGGRVLRALLAMTMPHSRATIFAARTGQVIAVLFAVLGIVGFVANPFLLLIAVFIFFAAQQESRLAMLHGAAEGRRVVDNMLTHFESLPAGLPIADAAQRILQTHQPVFPVVEHGLVPVGIVPRAQVLKAADEGKGASAVRDLSSRGGRNVNATDTLEDALRAMEETGLPVLPVVNPSGQLVGLVSVQQLSELASMRPMPTNGSPVR